MLGTLDCDLVAAGTVLPPTLTGPIPMPQVVAESDVESGALLSALRDEERW